MTMPAKRPTIAELLADLAAENQSLDDVVAAIPARSWSTPTPAAGWDVRDSISHLCFFDQAAILALTDPDGFEAHKTKLLADMAAAGPASPTVRDGAAGPPTPDVALGRALPDPSELLDRWRESRNAYLEAAGAEAAQPEPKRVPWYGPAMSIGSFTTARILEAWAHGVDVRDALGQPLEATGRLRHVCHIGVGARAFTFAAHSVADPGDPVQVMATGPDGDTWTWGEEGAENRIQGSALELALVFAQRRHHTRTAVVTTGPVAEQWLEIAQAFAGPATITAADR